MFWRKKKKIGRVESVDLPKLGVFGIHAKIDTGAYGSAIDCKDIEIVKRGGKKRLRFTLLDPESDFFTGKVIIAKKYRMVKVRNSFGNEERRYVITTPMILAGTELSVELSLADRGKMKYPVLVGRKALRNRFIVDVEHEYIATSPNRRFLFRRNGGSNSNNNNSQNG